MAGDGWKLVRERGEREWHLYGLNADQTETTDFASTQRDRVATMQATWETWARESDVLPKP